MLQYKKFASLFASAGTSSDAILQDLQNKSVILDDPNVIPMMTDDVPDNYILAAATLAQADCIVTGDKRLLALRKFEVIPIVTPKKFLLAWGR